MQVPSIQSPTVFWQKPPSSSGQISLKEAQAILANGENENLRETMQTKVKALIMEKKPLDEACQRVIGDFKDTDQNKATFKLFFQPICEAAAKVMENPHGEGEKVIIDGTVTDITVKQTGKDILVVNLVDGSEKRLLMLTPILSDFLLENHPLDSEGGKIAVLFEIDEMLVSLSKAIYKLLQIPYGAMDKDSLHNFGVYLFLQKLEEQLAELDPAADVVAERWKRLDFYSQVVRDLIQGKQGKYKGG